MEKTIQINNTYKSNYFNIFLSYFLIYFFILFSSGFGFQFNNGTLSLFIINLVPFLFFLINFRKINGFHFLRLSFVFTILLTFIFLSSILAQDSAKLIFITVLGYSASFILVLSINFNNYINIFRNFLLFIMLFSLLSYFFFQFFPNLLSFFPNIQSKYDNNNANYIYFSFVKFPTSPFRFGNQGLFVEPGGYVTFIGFTFLFEITRKKPSIFAIILILVTLLTTLSSMGYFIFVLVIIYLLHDSVTSKKVLNFELFLLLVLIISFVFLILITTLPDYIFRVLLSKITEFISISPTNDSVSARIDSIIYPFQIFINNIFFGGGKKAFEIVSESIGHQNLVFTALNWFAKSGIIFGLLNISGYLFFFFSILKSNNKISLFKFLYFIIFPIFLIFSQEFSENPLVINFVLFGISIFLSKLYRVNQSPSYSTSLVQLD